MTDTQSIANPGHEPAPTAAVERPAPVKVPSVSALRHGILSDPFGLRTLIILWCFWLLISWSITLAMDARVHTVRWMIFSAAFGMMAVWPAARLSQQLAWNRGSRLHRSRVFNCLSATFLDWLCLATILQVVIWPLMLVGQWTMQQTLWLDLAMLSWSLLIAAFVALGRMLWAGWARISMMLFCLLLLLGEPIWLGLTGIGFTDMTRHGESWQMRISPIQALWELTTTIQPYLPTDWINNIISTATAALLAWVILLAAAAFTRKSGAGVD